MKKSYIALAILFILIVSKPNDEKVLDSVEPVNVVQSPYEKTEPILDSVNIVPSIDVESKPRPKVKFKTFEYPPGYDKAMSKTNVKQKKSVKFMCDGRTYCSQMRSCAEAKFFIRNCPGTKMDGDNDGRPCESQHCRY